MATLVHMKLVWGLSGAKIGTCGFDFESNLAMTLPVLQDMVNRAATEWVSGVILRDQVCSQHTLERAEAYAYDLAAVAGGPPNFSRALALGPVVAEPTTKAGSDSGVACPPQCSPCVTFKTAIASRRSRGRVYFPAPNQNKVLGTGLMTAGYVTSLENKLESFMTAIENAATVPQTLTHSVVSLTSGDVNAVTIYDLKQRIDTQRRRLNRSLDISDAT